MGSQERSNTDGPDASEADTEEGLHERKLSLYGQGNTVGARLSPTSLDSFRGDLLSVLPFTRSSNAYNSIDECKYG